MGLILGGVLFDGWHNGQELRFDMHNSIWVIVHEAAAAGAGMSTGAGRPDQEAAIASVTKVSR